MAGSGANVGSAYVTIIPTMKGFGPAFSKGLGGMDFTGMGLNAGGMFASGIGSALMGAIGGIAASLTTTITSTISGSLDAAIARADALNAYPLVMQNLGYSADDASASLDTMVTHIQGLPTTLDSMAGAVQAMSPMFDDLNECTTVALAMNDALIAGGASAADQESALRQYTQMLAKGKPDMQDWNSLLATMPGQLDQIAKHLLGPTAGQHDLYEALQEGTLSMDDFNRALVELDQTGLDGLGNFEEQARAMTGGLRTQIDNLRVAVVNQLAQLIDKMMPYITPVIEWLKEKIGEIGAWLSEFFTTVMDNIDFEAFSAAFQTLSDAWHEGFGDEGASATTWGEAVANAINKLPALIEKLAPLVEKLGEAFKWLNDHAEQVAKYLPIVVLCIKGMQIAKVVTPLLQGLAARGIKPVGKAAGASAKQMLGMSVMLVALGVAVVLCAAGFWIMAQAAVQLADAGPMALGAFAIMLGGMAGLMAIAAALGPRLNTAAIGLIAFGAAIAIAAIGMGIMAQAAVALSAAGNGAMIMFGVMLVFIIALVAVVAALGPALIVGSIGFLILSAAMVVMAEAISIIIDAVVTLIQCIADNADQLNSIISTVSDAVNSFITTVTDGITSIINSVSDLVTAIGDAVSGVLDSLAGVFDSIGNAALNTGQGVDMLVDALIRLTNDTGVVDLGATCEEAARGIKNMVKAADGYEDLLQVAAAVMTMGVMGTSAGAALMLIGAGMTMIAVTAATGSAAIVQMSTAAGASAVQLNMAATAIRTFAGTALVISLFGRTATTAFKQFGTSAVQASTQAANAFRSAMASIAATVNGTRLQMQRIQLAPMPHFRWVGEFNPQTKATPSIAVDWYASGAVFSRPTIVGVGDAASPEIVAPQDMMAQTFDRSLSESGIRDEIHALRDDVRNMKLYLDGSALVGGIADRMDTALGQRQTAASRGF